MRRMLWMGVVLLLALNIEALDPLHSSYEVRKVARMDGISKTIERFQVAVFRTTFNESLYVNGTKLKHIIFNDYHQTRHDKMNRHVRGLTRLECPNATFDSHPVIHSNSSVFESDVPSHLMALADVPTTLRDLIHLFDEAVEFDDDVQFISVLVLSYQTNSSASFFNILPTELAQCTMRFLPEHDQTWLGSGILSTHDYNVFTGDVAMVQKRLNKCWLSHSLVDSVKHAAFRAADYTLHSPVATAQPRTDLQATSFFEFDISESAKSLHEMEVMECLALDQQQRLAEDLAMEMKTTFIGALIQMCTVPIAGMLIPILCAVILAIMCIPLVMLICALLAPYIEPIFARLEKGSDSPFIQMMNEISPVYYGLWGVKKRRMTRLSAMIGTGIMKPFMEQGSDGSGGWGPLVILIFGAIINNISEMYQVLDYKMSGSIPRFVIQLIQLLVPASIGNFMCGPLAARVVKATVSAVTHNVVHNSNYALTHSLTQSLTKAVTEAMHKQEKHYYYCLFCYYQGKYCEYCSTYNQYAQAGKNLNDLSTYPGA